MKRFVIIGLGNFGTTLAETLYRHGHDVIAIDQSEEAVDRIASHVTRAAVGDGRHRDALERLGAKECDAGIVSTGDDITSSILSTLALRDLEVADIYVKVVSRDHARIMTRMGVTETVFPERETAMNLGARLSSRSVFNYVRLGAGFAMQEMRVPSAWEGKTLLDLDLRVKRQISVVAVHDVESDSMQIPPDPEATLVGTETLLVAGKEEDLERLGRMD